MAASVSTMNRLRALMGHESVARARKRGSSDLVSAAKMKIGNTIFGIAKDSAGDLPIIAGMFERWEEKRNRLQELKEKKKAAAEKRSEARDKSSSESKKDDNTIASLLNEFKKSSTTAKDSAQAQSITQNRIAASQAAAADQGSSQIKLLTIIKDELKDIKGLLSIHGKPVAGAHTTNDNGGGGGGMMRSLWRFLPKSLRGRFGRRIERGAIRLFGRRGGRFARNFLWEEGERKTVMEATRAVEKKAAGKLAEQVVEKKALSAAEQKAAARAARRAARKEAQSVLQNKASQRAMARAAKKAEERAARAASKSTIRAAGSTVEKAAAEAGAKTIAADGLVTAATRGAPAVGETVGKSLFGRLSGYGSSAVARMKGFAGAAKGALGRVFSKGGGLLKAVKGGAGALLGKGLSLGRAARTIGAGGLLKAGAKGVGRFFAGPAALAVGEGLGVYDSVKGLFNGEQNKWNKDMGMGNSALGKTAGFGLHMFQNMGDELSFGGAGWVGRHLMPEFGKDNRDLSKTPGGAAEEAKLQRLYRARLAREAAARAAAKNHPKPITVAAITPAKLNGGGSGGAMKAPNISTIDPKLGLTPATPVAVTSAMPATIPKDVPKTKSDKKRDPMTVLVEKVTALYGLASDKSKGIYVAQSENALDPQQPPPPAPGTAPAPSGPAPGTVTANSGPPPVGTDLMSPAAQAQAASTMTPAGQLQPGAETGFGGFHPGKANGKIHINRNSIGSATRPAGKIGNIDVDAMWNRMSGTIAQYESGKAGYNAHHGGTIDDLTNMTIGQLKHMKGAMGKYQLLPQTTLKDTARALGYSDDTKFTPEVQEAMGKYLFVNRVKAGAKGGTKGIMNQLAHEWASLPMDMSGRGAYDGDKAGNRAFGGAQRASTLAGLISGDAAGPSAGSIAPPVPQVANHIDNATNEVAKSSSDNKPTVIVAPVQTQTGNRQPSRSGGGGNLTGPMVVRNNDGSVAALTNNFMSGSTPNS